MKRKLIVCVILILMIIGVNVLEKPIKNHYMQERIASSNKQYQQRIEKERQEISKMFDDGQLKHNEINDKLFKMAEKHPELYTIIRTQKDYPKDVLTYLARNEERIDYTMGLKEGIKKSPATTIGEYSTKFPKLVQFDKRWGYTTYGDSLLSSTGCAPTALAVVVNGLKHTDDVTPNEIAEYSYKQGYYVDGVGTSWDIMTKGAKHYGLKVKEIPAHKEIIFNALNSGKVIIASMKPGDFTRIGHFIVLEKIEKGKVRVIDPNSHKHTNQSWSYERLEPQFNNLWVFEKE